MDVEPDTSVDAKVAWGNLVACGPEQCLSAYGVTQDLGEYTGGSAIVALRLDRSGKWHHTAPIKLPPSFPNWVVPQGKNFLIGSTLQTGSAVHRVFADGTFELVAEGAQWANRPLCVTDDRSVFWNGSAVRVYAADFSPVGLAVPIAAADGVVGSTTCLAYSAAAAVRLRLSDGAALDSPLLAPTKYPFHWRMSAGYEAGNFVLFFQNDDGLYSFRIRESDGFLYDPDDTFNQKPGGQLIASTASVSTGEIQTFDWGNQLFVTWWEVINQLNVIVGARVNPTTGLRVSGPTTTYESAVGSELVGYPIYLTPTSGLLAWGLSGRPVSVADGSPPVFTPGVSTPLGYELPSRKHPTVAATAQQFLVAWDADDQVRATRVDTTGAYLDAPSLQLGAGTHAAAAAAGANGYLVTWLDGTDLRRRFVKSDGTLGESLTPLDIEAGVQPHTTKLVFDGDRFVFSWLSATVLKAIRLGANAEPLDATPLTLATQVNCYDVTADTAPAPDRRSFAFSYRLVFGEEKARLLRSQSGVLVQPELTLGTPPSGDGSLAAAASDGTQIALGFWSSSQNSMARGYLDSVGVAFAPSTYEDVGFVRTGKLWFDGNSYMLLESKAADGSLGFRRFKPTLAPVDSAKAGSGYLIEPAYDGYAFAEVAAASNGAGKSLVAYPQLDPARLGGTIKVRVINNDGLKDPNASSGAGGAGGDGLGGAPDSGGTGGLNGGTGGTGGLNGGTGGLNGEAGGSGEAGSSGEGGLNTGGESTGDGGMPQAGGAGTGGDVSTGGSSVGGTSQGGTDAMVGGAANGGMPGTGGAVQAGTGGMSPPQAGSGAVSGTAGSSSSAGASSGNNHTSTDSGCGCRVVAPSRNGGHMPLTALAVLGVALGRIRSRRARRISPTMSF